MLKEGTGPSEAGLCPQSRGLPQGLPGLVTLWGKGSSRLDD